MANNLDILSQLTEKILGQIAKFEAAKKEKEKAAIKKEILDLQKKREETISKLRTELK